ncbi:MULTISPECIES: helix-turn-helix domain-containing protein [Burkholderia]|uniref:DNA-binding protein n=1 Tax=Burkholderia savannae TaxID=1637837 RepID=A0ABR5TB16_9BURK|nr:MULTISPECIES: XRE family transcriptional regulator [Burkholderia]AOJ80000.1 DNA-binding protein [Burkholderia savannae]AOK46230.1 DNA-binding protein [Burkholderia sp. MSMB617WGS]KGR96762.1 helix-turn-helix family protein [Burkholderia sp. ABCPW 111]KVK74483.1 DNA-binding protein [Burkholderia sp. MSMB1498]KWZ42202.1 DNA-binding protein [Burkholderia savannae]
MDVNQLIARRVRALRDLRGYSLDALAERSKVSRSNISLIERAQSSPTAVVLERLANALGVSLASLFEDDRDAHAASPLARAAEQPVWKDPASGYVRRSLSPAVASPLQLVEVRFPPGERVAYDTGERDADWHQQIWMLEGEMDITSGDDTWRVAAGDCLAMRVDRPTLFFNPGRKAARYVVALAAANAIRAGRIE